MDCNDKMYLREVDLSDMTLLYRWVNDSVVRHSAFQDKEIEYEEHKAWFQKVLNDKTVKIYILMVGILAVGQVRVDFDGKIGLIDYSVSKEFRGKGYGKEILLLLEKQIRKSYGKCKKLIGCVKKNNIASQHVFSAIGYKVSIENDYYKYEKFLINIVIASSKTWHKKYIEEIQSATDTNVYYVDDKEMLNVNLVKQHAPQYIFFPHWSYIIPADIYENFECVIFHMTDLPFGRGGSPLQNLISRGIYETQLSALRCTKELDAGDIYLKCPLSLWGNAEEIYLRAAELTKDMMIRIIKEKLQPKPQVGNPVVFKRRKPSESNIEDLEALDQVFDYIRMLDAEGYPPAFLDTEKFHLEFSRAARKDGYVYADVKIKMR